ncbi:MAG: hypothetical protein KGZ41_08420 [Dethiobacter sp.]|nr:hypothetical protein [Dethiobacter sp.]MCL4463172.1 hypothetical protein [Bacillota bacterium]MCL5992924.1 hypothetical protein [Bacillota bacterium]
MQLKDILQIAAFVPVYTDGKGQGLEIYYRDGTVGWQGISLHSFICRMARVFTVNVREARRRHAPLVGQKNLIPLVLEPFLVYVPIKVRTPLISGDPAYGYFRLRSVQQVAETPGSCTLLLEGGQQISVIQAVRTVRSRLRSARKLEAHALEQLCQVMEAESCAMFLCRKVHGFPASPSSP